MKKILDHHDVYYVYSKIWVEDFCVWAQAYASDDSLNKLAKSVESLKMEKSQLGWDLQNLEAATRWAQDRDSDSDDESDDD